MPDKGAGTHSGRKRSAGTQSATDRAWLLGPDNPADTISREFTVDDEPYLINAFGLTAGGSVVIQMVGAGGESGAPGVYEDYYPIPNVLLALTENFTSWPLKLPGRYRIELRGQAAGTVQVQAYRYTMTHEDDWSGLVDAVCDVAVAATPSVNMLVDLGTCELSAEVILSALPNNCLTIETDGLFMPCSVVVDPVPVDPNCIPTGELGFVDTSCIGWVSVQTNGDPDCQGWRMEASPIISPNAGNLLTCESNGLFVPDAAGQLCLESEDDNQLLISPPGTGRPGQSAGCWFFEPNYIIINAGDIAVIDTVSVDMSLIDPGGGPPFNLFSDVKIYPSTDNLLVERDDTPGSVDGIGEGLYVRPTIVQEGTGIDVTGLGLPSDPYIVSSECCGLTELFGQACAAPSDAYLGTPEGNYPTERELPTGIGGPLNFVELNEVTQQELFVVFKAGQGGDGSPYSVDFSNVVFAGTAIAETSGVIASTVNVVYDNDSRTGGGVVQSYQPGVTLEVWAKAAMTITGVWPAENGVGTLRVVAGSYILLSGGGEADRRVYIAEGTEGYTFCSTSEQAQSQYSDSFLIQGTVIPPPVDITCNICISPSASKPGDHLSGGANGALPDTTFTDSQTDDPADVERRIHLVVSNITRISGASGPYTVDFTFLPDGGAIDNVQDALGNPQQVSRLAAIDRTTGPGGTLNLVTGVVDTSGDAFVQVGVIQTGYLTCYNGEGILTFPSGGYITITDEANGDKLVFYPPGGDPGTVTCTAGITTGVQPSFNSPWSVIGADDCVVNDLTATIRTEIGNIFQLYPCNAYQNPQMVVSIWGISGGVAPYTVDFRNMYYQAQAFGHDGQYLSTNTIVFADNLADLSLGDTDPVRTGLAGGQTYSNGATGRATGSFLNTALNPEFANSVTPKLTGHVIITDSSGLSIQRVVLDSNGFIPTGHPITDFEGCYGQGDLYAQSLSNAFNAGCVGLDTEITTSMPGPLGSGYRYVFSSQTSGCNETGTPTDPNSPVATVCVLETGGTIGVPLPDQDLASSVDFSTVAVPLDIQISALSGGNDGPYTIDFTNLVVVCIIENTTPAVGADVSAETFDTFLDAASQAQDLTINANSGSTVTYRVTPAVTGGFDFDEDSRVRYEVSGTIDIIDGVNPTLTLEVAASDQSLVPCNNNNTGTPGTNFEDYVILGNNATEPVPLKPVMWFDPSDGRGGTDQLLDIEDPGGVAAQSAVEKTLSMIIEDLTSGQTGPYTVDFTNLTWTVAGFRTLPDVDIMTVVADLTYSGGAEAATSPIQTVPDGTDAQVNCQLLISTPVWDPATYDHRFSIAVNGFVLITDDVGQEQRLYVPDDTEGNVLGTCLRVDPGGSGYKDTYTHNGPAELAP